MTKDCKRLECERPAKARGLCDTHYAAWRRNEGATVIARTAEARFMAKVEKTETCWLWHGGVSGDGYGRFRTDGTTQGAHRWAYEHFVGPIPDGLAIDHVASRGCTNRNCVNPAHLEPVTSQENNLRAPTSIAARNAAKTACPKGHAYDAANTYVNPKGKRDCRACRREAARACRERRRSA